MSSAAQNHLTDEQLLLHSDGELNGANLASACAHLEACSSCRARLEELTGGVDAFLLFRSRVLIPALPAPLHGWADLDAQFERLDHPWKARFDTALGGFRSAFRGLGYNMAAALGLLILIFLIFQPWQATVSAAKLLARAIAAQSAALRSTPKPVVHQKLRIQFNPGAPGSRARVDYESWRDFRSGRFRGAVSPGAAGAGGAAGSSDSDDERIAGLRRVYAANHLDWQAPLSAEAYQRWSSALAAGRASVTRERREAAEGDSWLILTTLATPTPRGDEIGKAQLMVRASDWHPVAVHLSLKDREYEISEAAFQVVPLSQVESSVFAGAANGAEQVNSPAPGNSQPGARAAKGDDRQQHEHPRKISANALAPTRPAANTAPIQDRPGAADADTFLDLPITLNYPAPAPLDQGTPAAPRLNLGLPLAPMPLNPGMALAEQLARQQELMQKTQQQRPIKLAPPPPAVRRQKTKEKNSKNPGK